MTTYLKFDSEEAFLQAFAPYLIESQVPPYIDGIPVGIVGVICKPSGNILQTDYGMAEEWLPIPGFHVNLYGDCPESLTPFIIPAPTNPRQVLFL